MHSKAWSFGTRTLSLILLVGCAEMNGGWGLGKGKRSAGNDKQITMYVDNQKIYKFRSPPNPDSGWRQFYDIFENDSNRQIYGIDKGWVKLSNRSSFQGKFLPEYFSALQGKQTLVQAHNKYFSSFYPNATVLAQVQRNVKGVQCMQTKAEYESEFLVELQCPVFLRNTFGTITYLMNINQKLTEQDFYGPPGVLEFYVKKYGEVEGTKLFKRDQLTDSIAESGAKNAKEYLDYHMPAFNHMVDTLEFIEPASQKVPAGFSLDEQFKRMQDPKWKL